LPARCEEHGADRDERPTDLPRFLLSPRQREVLTLAGQGLTWRQISQALGIAPGTVRGHIVRARERLGALNTTHAVVLAIANDQIRVETILLKESGDEDSQAC